MQTTSREAKLTLLETRHLHNTNWKLSFLKEVFFHQHSSTYTPQTLTTHTTRSKWRLHHDHCNTPTWRQQNLVHSSHPMLQNITLDSTEQHYNRHADASQEYFHLQLIDNTAAEAYIQNYSHTQSRLIITQYWRTLTISNLANC